MIFLHSHRFAYHQEDILILLANARLAEVEAVEYCNLNRVMWGQREVTHELNSEFCHLEID